MHVLIVDHQPLVRKMAKRALDDMGVPLIHEEMNINNALICMKKAPINFVIIDARMRGDTGFRLLRAIRTGQNWMKRDIPVLIWTELKDKEILIAAKSLDANAYLSRETDLSTIESRLIKILKTPIILKETYDYVAAPIPGVEKIELLYQRMLEKKIAGAGNPITMKDIQKGGILPHDVMTLKGQFLLAKGRKVDTTFYQMLQDIEGSYGLRWGMK